MRYTLLTALAWLLILSGVLLPSQRKAVQARSHGQEGTPPAATIPVVPIQVSTPRPDGSIIHVVDSGQFLANIALAYAIPLQDLLSINGLTEQSVIFPGDKLFIRLPSTATPATELAASGTSGTEQPVSSASVTPTPKRPTPTPTEAPILSTSTPVSLAPVATALPSPQSSELAVPDARQESGGPDFLLITVLILGVAGTALVALGSTLKRNA